MPLHFLLLLLVAYVSGSIPWSVWLSRWLGAVDPRSIADGNPGATNAFRGAGWRVGTAVLVLDFSKAFLPVAIARWSFTFTSIQLFWIALAPMVGHAFSLFLAFRGGRGLTAMFGTWTGLTLYEVPTVMGITALAAMVGTRNDDIRTLAIPVAAAAYLLVRGRPVCMFGLMMAQLALLAVRIGLYHLEQASGMVSTAEGTENR